MPSPLKYERVEDDQNRVLNMHHDYKTRSADGGRLIVPARQSVAVYVVCGKDVRDLINGWPGKRFFRVFVEGVMTRDIQ